MAIIKPNASALYKTFQPVDARTNPHTYAELWDDFLVFDDESSSLQGWVKTQATTGTAAVIDGANGILELDSNSTTANQGIQLQLATESFLPAADRNIYFEARVRLTDTPDGTQLFIGLAPVDTTVFASGANSTDNHIGFEMSTASQTSSAGNLQFVAEKATVRGTEADVLDITDNEWFTVGFHVYGTGYVQAYVNGDAVGDPLETANIPVTELTPTFVCQSNGTVDPILYVDYVRVVQER